MLTVALFAVSTVSQAQVSFSVSPGMNLNGATFGYVINDKIIPYVGIQLLKANFTFTDKYQGWDYSGNRQITETMKMEASGSVFAPTLGIKAYVFGQEKLKGYVNAAFTKPFINGKFTDDGDEVEEVAETIKNLSIFGLQAGFGAEYFIDTNFSVSGEFGLSYIKMGYENTYEDSYYNPVIDDDVDYDGKINVNLNMIPTYSRISLNFYF